MNILITAPSLDENTNVSGISTLVKTIIQNNTTSNKYIHFRVGKPDNQRRGIIWLWNQFTLIPRFFICIVKNKIQLVHLNTDLTSKSIFRDAQLIFLAKIILKKKIVLHIHGGLYLMSPPNPKSILNFLITKMLSHSYKRIVLSTLEKITIKNNYGFDCLILPNAIRSLPFFKNKIFNEVLNFIFIGRIVKSKGILFIGDILKDFSEDYQKFIFHIYGTGPDLEILLKQLNNYQGLQFHYHGIINGQAKMTALENAHIFLLPSLYGEGLPIAMLEAMNSGCIPIVSDDASMSSVVKNGLNGFLIRKGNKNDMKENIKSILYNRDQLPKISHAAYETIQDNYNIESFMTALSSTYV